MFFGDKIYSDNDFFNRLFNEKQSVMYTPIKTVKGTDELTKQREKAHNEPFPSAVAAIRQPIESLFNRINEKLKFNLHPKCVLLKV